MNQFVEKYGQILLPLITPYDANEEVDYGKYAELIEYLIQNDLCDSLIVTGTTGEASLLTFDERVKLMETAVKTAAGRKPVIAGTGCASTKETIALTKAAEDLGIDVEYQFEEPKAGDTIAELQVKDFGTIQIKLFPDMAPKAVENFVTHAKDGYFDGLTFHRVINEFMIQGGDPKGDGTGGESIWGQPFEDEFSNSLYPWRGALREANGHGSGRRPDC